MPVTSYAPEMLALFQQAFKREITVKCEDEKDAHRLRFRLHNLRKEMRNESHYLLSVAESVSFHIDGASLIAKPSDDTHIAAIRNAGIEIEDSYLDPPSLSGPTPSISEDALAAFRDKGKTND